MSKKAILTTISFVAIVAIGVFILFPFKSSGQITELEIEAKNSFDQANFEESVAYYKEILELDPTHVNARIGLALSYKEMARLDLAESTLLQGIELVPTEPLFYTHLSSLYLSQSNIFAALSILEDGNKQSDVNEQYERLLSQIHIEMGRPYIQEGFSREIDFVWTDERGLAVPLEAEWTVSDRNLALIEEDEGDLMIHALSSGTVTVVASTEQVTRQLEVEVKEQVVEEMHWITPDEPIIATDYPFELEVAAFDANEQPMEITPLWTLENQLGTIIHSETNKAIYRAEHEGVETISAEFDGITISMDIRIAENMNTIVTSKNGQGEIQISPMKNVYEAGETIEIKAIPAPGWTFVRWTDDATGTSPVQTISINTHLTIGAIFEIEQPEHTLNVSISGEGQIIRSSLSTTFEDGETVTLTARPHSGYEFEKWTGSIESTNNSITFSMNDDLSVRAIFIEVNQDRSTSPVQEINREEIKVEQKRTQQKSNTETKTEVKRETEKKKEPTSPQPTKEKEEIKKEEDVKPVEEKEPIQPPKEETTELEEEKPVQKETETDSIDPEVPSTDLEEEA